MKGGRIALERVKLSCFELNQPKGIMSTSSCLLFFLIKKAGKIVHTVGNVFFLIPLHL